MEGGRRRVSVVIITPPMVQSNAPYSAGPRLAGFLRSKGVAVFQWDASLELMLTLFPRSGLCRAADAMKAATDLRTPKDRSVAFFLKNVGRYLATINEVISFLQGACPDMAGRVLSMKWLPEGPRFDILNSMASIFSDGVKGRRAVLSHFFGKDERAAAMYMASLYVDDIADAIKSGVDERFGLSKFAEESALRVARFSSFRSTLESSFTIIDLMIDEMTKRKLAKFQPDLAALTVPFPGAFYGAMRIARQIRMISPNTRTVIGGGYVTRVMRLMRDRSLFDYVDYVVLDKGEEPLLEIVRSLEGKKSQLTRTFVMERGRVVYKRRAASSDAAPDAATLDYTGLDLSRYVCLAETPNPMLRMWTCRQWIKMTLADGCYWAKCRFCDTSLPSVVQFVPARIDRLVRKIEIAMRETGWRGVHFVDEAAPPRLLRELSLCLLKKKLTAEWWVNIRLEPTFERELAELMANAGCLAVTTGLEAANDRLLRLLRKGINIATAARVMKVFRDAGIMVHVYLMYGCPTQTVQETVDALEIVRQLFEAGCVVSCYWHRFALSPFSAIARLPERFGLRMETPPRSCFACDHLAFTDKKRCDHDMLGLGLRKATYNYMLGLGLDHDVRGWFSAKVPASTIPPNHVRRLIGDE